MAEPARAKAEAAPPPVLQVTEDPRYARAPKVRLAMSLLLPKPEAARGPVRLTVAETLHGAEVRIQDGGAFEREVTLNVRELRELGRFCARIAGRVAHRPEGTP